MVAAALEKNLRDSFAFGKTKSSRTHALLFLRLTLMTYNAFMTEWRRTKHELSKIIYNRTLHETLRQNRLDYTNVAVDN